MIKRGKAKSEEKSPKKQKISNDQFLLFKGDRHFLDEKTQRDWDACFFDKSPKQIITVTDDHMLNGLTIAGITLSPLDQAAYILEYCMKKGCAPKIFFSNAEQARNALQTQEYSASGDQLNEFIEMLRDFTEQVKNCHFHEHPFGGIEIEKGETVEEARAREVWEETGQAGTALLLFDTEPRKSRGMLTSTAVFLSEVDDSAIELYNARELPSNWQCPLAWYKVIDGIDMELAAKHKALCETVGCGFFPAAVHPLMDKKNVAVTEKFLRN